MHNPHNFPVIFSAAGRTDWPRPAIVDYLCSSDLGGDGLTAYGRKTLEEVRAEYPDAEVLSEEEGYVRYNKAWIKPAVRITHERFDEMLNVLPPRRWYNHGATESFHVSERIAGNVVSHFCRIGADYFELQDLYTLVHHEIVTKCSAAA